LARRAPHLRQRDLEEEGPNSDDGDDDDDWRRDPTTMTRRRRRDPATRSTRGRAGSGEE
jgi:hypothetical protein